MLDMEHNALNYIDEHAFADLFMLTELVLDDNKIVHLSSDTLFDQSNLMDLRIARNTITLSSTFRSVNFVSNKSGGD
jgi:hypothetical protein